MKPILACLILIFGLFVLPTFGFGQTKVSYGAYFSPDLGAGFPTNYHFYNYKTGLSYSGGGNIRIQTGRKFFFESGLRFANRLGWRWSNVYIEYSSGGSWPSPIPPFYLSARFMSRFLEVPINLGFLLTILWTHLSH